MGFCLFLCFLLILNDAKVRMEQRALVWRGAVTTLGGRKEE